VRKFLLGILFVLSLMVGVCLLLGQISMYYPVGTLRIGSWLAYVFIILYCINLVLVLFWFLVGKPIGAMINIACALAVLPASRASFSIKRDIASEISEKQLSIITYNTNCLGWNITAESPIFDYLAEQEPDIICLQEFEVRKTGDFLHLQDAKKRLGMYSYTYFNFSCYRENRQYGLAIFSKYPLIHKTSILYKSRANLSNYCDVVVGEDTFRLFNNHLESIRLEVKDIDEPLGLLGKYVDIERNIFNAGRLRAEQADSVRLHIAQSPYPVICVGDFNDIPVSYVYRHVLRGAKDEKTESAYADLRDAYLDANPYSLGASYIRKYLRVRIDYTFYSTPLRVMSSKIDCVPYSDHFPLFTTFVW